jgi:16S rRNA (guanine966-N2)-methyltransferase
MTAGANPMPRQRKPSPPQQARVATPGDIRIIGGELKRSRIAVPDEAGLRPTPARLRETLFNWLAPRPPGARVLDLCAGSGALGFEALSRGAAHGHFNEPNPRLAAALLATATRLKLADRVTITREDARSLIVAAPFDIVFIDPPYALDLWPALFARLPQWLSADGWVYVEWPRGARPRWPDGFRVRREAHAGIVECALLERDDGSASVEGHAAAEPRATS